VGRLGLRPRLVGRIGSEVRVIVSVFNKNTRRVLSYDVLRQQKTGVMTRGVDLPSSPAYNVEPVTNTSSSSCANNGRRTPRWVFDACRHSLRLCFSHFATRTVDNTVDLYAAKPDIHPESRCLPTPPAFDGPVRGGGFPSEYLHPVWYGKARMMWLPDGENISKMCFFVLTWSTNVTDTQIHVQTDTLTAYDIGRAYA